MKPNTNTLFEEKIRQSLREESPISIDMDRMRQTIKTLHAYMPDKKVLTHVPSHALMHRLRIGLTYVNLSYWLISAILYMASLLLTLMFQSPYTLMFLSPLPFILMFYQDTHGREWGLLEMELACTYSPQEMMMARLLITAGYNFMAMTIMSIVLYSLNPLGNYFMILISWITPFIVVGNIILMILTRIRSNYILSSVVLMWLAAILWMVNTPTIAKWLYSIHLMGYMALWTVGIITLMMQLVRYSKSMTERSGLIAS